jgi:protein-disulfide isomerase
MSKPVLALGAALLLLAGLGGAQNATPAKKTALDKATLEAYVRHIYVMDSRITIKVSDATASEVPGFKDVTVHASMGPQTQDIKFLISNDGSKILQATVYDVNHNPFHSDLDKIKTLGSPNYGTENAPVVIVAFSDFECPYCREEAKMLRENLLKAYPTQVRYYLKTFPLESLHPWARAGAIASRCASKQSDAAFWSYHDWIFEHQAEITADNLKDKVGEWAKTAQGVDPLQLNSCMASKETEPIVNADLEMGHKLDINGTPTLFVNGRRNDRTIDWPNLKAIIDYEIEYQKTAHDAGDDCGCSLDLKLPFGPAATPAPGIKKK